MSFLDSLMRGLELVGNVESFLALGLGVAIGVIGGAIPGMSATMAVALTLPFTFSMAPITGILLLLGLGIRFIMIDGGYAGRGLHGALGKRLVGALGCVQLAGQ